MAYKNKTYVAFASEDIRSYWLMTAWRDNQHIDFNFFDAHDINVAEDTSQPETIRRRLRERLANTKQAIVLVSPTTKPKAAHSSSFLYYEIEVIARLGLPVVFANLNQVRSAQPARIPSRLASPLYTMSTTFQPKIIQYALDNFPTAYASNLVARTPKEGPYRYNDSVYTGLGL